MRLSQDFEMSKEESQKFRVSSPMTNQLKQTINSIEYPQSNTSRPTKDKLNLILTA